MVTININDPRDLILWIVAVVVFISPWVAIYRVRQRENRRKALVAKARSSGRRRKFYLPKMKLNRFQSVAYQDNPTIYNHEVEVQTSSDEFNWTFKVGQFQATLKHQRAKTSGQYMTFLTIQIPAEDSPPLTIDVSQSNSPQVAYARKAEHLRDRLKEADGWRMSTRLEEQFFNDNAFIQLKQLIRTINGGDCSIGSREGKFTVISHNTIASQLALHEFRNHAVEVFRAYAQLCQLTATSWEDESVRFDWWDVQNLIREKR